MMTEDHAKTKWCPLARTPNYNATIGAATNRNMHGQPLATAMCIGSACMAWQLKGMENPAYPDSSAYPMIVAGYCGAFGAREMSDG